VELKETYFSEQTPEFERVRSKINYSLEKLNSKQSLFQVDTDLTQPNDIVSVESSLIDAVSAGLIKRLIAREPTLPI
jgi:hypothetical protein